MIIIIDGASSCYVTSQACAEYTSDALMLASYEGISACRQRKETVLVAKTIVASRKKDLMAVAKGVCCASCEKTRYHFHLSNPDSSNFLLSCFVLLGILDCV